MLRAVHIDFRYPGSTAPLFRDLSFELSSTGFHALFGPSGVGKTTLARMIAGGITGQAGTIDTGPLTRILYTYNLERLPGWSSVGDHLRWNTPAGREQLMAELVRAFGLERCLASRFSRLSLGQQNRTNLARYLVQDFELLIMDESLANVDEVTRRAIILKMKALFADRAFVYISHNVSEVARFCRDIVVLRSHRKQPQAVVLRGMDEDGSRPLDRGRYEHTMLEMVNAG